MIDLSLYDYLEKLVSEKEEDLKAYQEVYGCGDSTILKVNSLQSIVRNSFSEKQQEEPAYTKIFYSKGNLESIKFENIKVDFDLILSLLSEAYNISSGEKWAVFMAVLSVISTLKKMKKRLSPAMAVIVFYLYENGYEKKLKRAVEENELKKKIKEKFETELPKLDFAREFPDAIDDLLEWKIIELIEGNIWLMEEVKI